MGKHDKRSVVACIVAVKELNHVMLHDVVFEIIPGDRPFVIRNIELCD